MARVPSLAQGLGLLPSRDGLRQGLGLVRRARHAARRAALGCAFIAAEWAVPRGSRVRGPAPRIERAGRRVRRCSARRRRGRARLSARRLGAVKRPVSAHSSQKRSSAATANRAGLHQAQPDGEGERTLPIIVGDEAPATQHERARDVQDVEGLLSARHDWRTRTRRANANTTGERERDGDGEDRWRRRGSMAMAMARIDGDREDVCPVRVSGPGPTIAPRVRARLRVRPPRSSPSRSAPSRAVAPPRRGCGCAWTAPGAHGAPGWAGATP